MESIRTDNADLKSTRRDGLRELMHIIQAKKGVAFGGTRTHATKGDYDLNVAP